MSECVVYGVNSSYVFDIDETLWRAGISVRAYITNRPSAQPPDGLHPLLAEADVEADLLAMPAVVGIGTPPERAIAVDEAKAAGFSEFPPILDPTAILARSVESEQGVVVNAGSVVAPHATLGEFAVINRSSSIGHDADVGPYAFVGPGAVISGNVRVGAGALIGAGAIILPGRSVGSGSRVGAGAVVVHDVAVDTIVAGNPARELRS